MAVGWRSHLDRQSVEGKGPPPPSVSDCIPGGDMERLTAQTSPYLHRNRPTPHEEFHSLKQKKKKNPQSSFCCTDVILHAPTPPPNLLCTSVYNSQTGSRASDVWTEERISSPEVDLADFRMYFVCSGFSELLVPRFLSGHGEQNIDAPGSVLSLL